jgi:hypothetical protein
LRFRKEKNREGRNWTGLSRPGFGSNPKPSTKRNRILLFDFSAMSEVAQSRKRKGDPLERTAQRLNFLT